MDKAEKIKELADVASYLSVQLKEIAMLKRTVYSEDDPVGYSLIYLQPDHVICSCGKEMVSVPYDNGQKWVCPECGSEVIVESPERGSRA